MLFNHKQETEDPEHELKTLESEHAELSREISVLAAKTRATDYKPEKDVLEKQKGELYTKATHLRDRIDSLKESVAITKLEAMIRANAADILLYVNTQRIRLSENLIVELQFSCGRHTLKMPAYELIRYQTNMANNQVLLAHWTTLINSKETRTRQIRCKQCMKERREYAKKNHVASNKPTGIALIKIQAI